MLSRIPSQFTIYICKSDTRRTPPTFSFKLHVLGGARQPHKKPSFYVLKLLLHKKDYLITSQYHWDPWDYSSPESCAPWDTCSRATILSWILMLISLSITNARLFFFLPSAKHLLGIPHLNTFSLLEKLLYLLVPIGLRTFSLKMCCCTFLCVRQLLAAAFNT